ncbi:hypothetical protein ABPG74_001485 [Tetrahymena malaccensis]
MEAFSLQCPQHPQKKIKFLVNTISKDQQVLVCSQCISDSLIKKGEFILISQIMQQGENSLIQKWPPLEDSQIINKLADLAQQQIKNNPANKIISFFDTFKQELLQKIDSIQKRVLIKINDLNNQNEMILQKYQEISQIKQLREILTNKSQQNYENQEQECNMLIKKLEEQKEQNSLILQDLYLKASQVTKQIDFEKNNTIQKQISRLLDDLNFFEEKQNQESEQIDKSENIQLINTKQNFQYEQKSTSEIIYDLISNKSNYCSDSFLTDIKLILKRIEPLLSQIKTQNIYQTDKKPIKFHTLKQENFDKIENYVHHISKIYFKKKQYIKSIEQSQQIQEISKILNNKWNFLTDSFKNNFIEYLIETYPFLSSLDVNQVVEPRENITSLQHLNDAETKELFQLISKRIQFKQQQNFNLSHSKYFMDQLQNELSLYIPQNILQNLILKFPIFDLVEVNKKIDILKKIYLYEDSISNYLIIKKFPNNQISVTSSLNNNIFTDCISNISFQKNMAYVIRMKIENISGYRSSSIQFKVGFKCITSFLKFFLSEIKLERQFVLTNNQLHQPLSNNTFDTFSNGDQIEIRIYLDQLQLEVLDYPFYINRIIMINQNLKDNLQNVQNCKLFLSIPSNLKLTIFEAFANREQE